MDMKCLTEAIAARLSAARRVRYDSARSFAKEFNLPESTYSQHETGKRALSVNALMEYSDRLNVDPGWMLTGDGLPYPEEHDCTEKQAELYGHLNDLDKEQLFECEQRFLIQHDYAMLDVPLFKEVLLRILEVSRNHSEIEAEDLLEFAFDAYNSVVQTSADVEDKIKMIELSIKSLMCGIVTQSSKQKQDKERSA